MRQTVLLIVLVLIVVLSAHYGQVTRQNMQLQRVMHDTTLLSSTLKAYEDDDDDNRPMTDSVAAAKD